jgi:hypothetical protein
MLMFTQAVIFLKVVGYGVTGLLSVAFLHESGLLKGVKFSMIKKVKAFELENEHTTVMGITRHGKTYATILTLSKLAGEGVLFFNTQHETVPPNYVEFNPDLHSWEQIENLLKKNRKINFLPSTDPEQMQKQLSGIIRKLYNGEKRNLRLAIDEVHLFKKTSLNDLIRVATTGLRWGIKGIFLTQRPAKVDNTLLTQSTKHIIFRVGLNDYDYLQQHGFPAEQLKLEEKYHFKTFDGIEAKGTFMVVE